MATLDARARARLPDSAFAYVDPQGRRRLPINDEAHVRNALSRFDRVDFHDEAARDRARMRILRAAKRLGIMPLGFVGGQLRPERRLPRGQVTFLLVDLEGSTELLHRLGDGYGPLLNRIRRLVRTAVRRSGGREVDARGDELFVVFEVAVAAVAAASAIRQTVRDHAWPEGIAPRVRAGIHTGRPTLTESGYVGLSVHTVARIADAGHGGQILVSGAARDAAGGGLPDGSDLVSLGRWRLKGLRDPVELFQLADDGRVESFPALRPVARPVR